MKSHIYAGLVAMLNMRSFDIAADVIDIVASLLDVLLAKGGWIEVKCVLRFYTECFNCQVSCYMGEMGSFIIPGIT